MSVTDGTTEDAERSLSELALLVDTAGGESAGIIIQRMDHPSSATYVGSGKLLEIRDLVNTLGADGIVCDDELSPAQLENLENQLNTAVLDRTMVILDIFAQRAKTSEGKIQVELAQLRYRSIRLTGMRRSLSRLGGGIGTRGPGEKKLEIDRRLIHQRIGQLKSELAEVQVHRELTRKQRKKNKVFVCALVGYTNAGKSTMLNTLTGAGVFAEDKLFATLDPTSRMLDLGQNCEVCITDTVGFISKLPHHLIEAFRSTLEEAKYSDLILHVADASNPELEQQMHVVYDTLSQLGINDRPVITLLNKADLTQPQELIINDFRADHTLSVSAKTGEGLEALKQLLLEAYRSQKIFVQKLYPYDQAGKIAEIRSKGQLISEEYRADGIAVTAYIPAELTGQVAQIPDLPS